MPPRVPLVLGVTSHRNLVADEIEGLRKGLRGLFLDLQHRFPELPLMVLSSLAEGGDRVVAREALACGAELIVVLPMLAALYIDDFASGESRAEFTELCRNARVLQVPLLPRNTLDRIAHPGPQRNAQYAEAGVFVSSHCHILLTVWDGRLSDRFGGTAQIVRYHLEGILPGSIDRRLIQRPLLDRSDEGLVYHLACSRMQHDGTPARPLPPLEPLQARWLSADGTRPASEGLPEEFLRVFHRMVQFNTDAARYATAVPCMPDDLLDALFQTADTLAIHFRKRLLMAMRGVHVLAALMGLAFIGYSDLPAELVNLTPLLYLFIVLFAAGVVLDRVARRREWHRKFIDYRALAEGLRVQRYWRRAGIATSDSAAFAHDNFLQKQDIELGWIRNVMRAAGLQAPKGDSEDRSTLDAVIDEWIGAVDRGGQLDYYTRRTAQRTRVHHAAKILGRACLWTGMGIGMGLALFHAWLGPDTTSSLVAAIGVLAIIAATRESYAWRRADKELIKQYRFMRNIFASARMGLDAETDPRLRRQILEALGEAALAEHAEWALMHRERPLEHGRL